MNLVLNKMFGLAGTYRVSALPGDIKLTHIKKALGPPNDDSEGSDLYSLKLN